MWVEGAGTLTGHQHKAEPDSTPCAQPAERWETVLLTERLDECLRASSSDSDQCQFVEPKHALNVFSSAPRAIRREQSGTTISKFLPFTILSRRPSRTAEVSEVDPHVSAVVVEEPERRRQSSRDRCDIGREVRWLSSGVVTFSTASQPLASVAAAIDPAAVQPQL